MKLEEFVLTIFQKGRNQLPKNIKRINSLDEIKGKTTLFFVKREALMVDKLKISKFIPTKKDKLKIIEGSWESGQYNKTNERFYPRGGYIRIPEDLGAPFFVTQERINHDEVYRPLNYQKQ